MTQNMARTAYPHASRAHRSRPGHRGDGPFRARRGAGLDPERSRDQRRGLAGRPVELPARHRRRRAARVGQPVRRGPSRRQGREDRRARQRRGVRQPRAVQEVAGPQADPVRQGLRLLRAQEHRPERVRGPRPLPQRRLRARHARDQHDRRDAEQRARPDRPRLRRDDHPGQGAQRARRGRRGDDRRRHPLRRQARRADHQPVVRVRVEHDVGHPGPVDRGRRPLRALQERHDHRRCGKHRG